MKKQPLISVIITNKNAYKWLDTCITSLKNQTFQDFEVVFVDDGSTDNSLEYVKKKYGWMTILENLENVGFARANNTGAAASQGKYLLILNTDAYLENDTLKKIAEYIKKYPDHKMMQLDVRHYDKKPFTGLNPHTSIDIFGYPIGSKTFFYADACAMVISRDLFFKLRGFDEKHFIYLEDVDLSWRARLIGENIYFMHGIYAYHYGGGTSNATTQSKGKKHATTLKRRYDAQKNNIRMLIKNYSFFNMLWTVPVSILLASLEGWLYLFSGNLRGFIVLHKAIIWNIFNIGDSLKYRQWVQQTRTVDDREIKKLMSKTISKLHSLLNHGIPIMK